LSACLGIDKQIAVAIGLETADDTKRELCLNKGTTLAEIEAAVSSVRGLAEIQLYVLVGLPFLTEAESIDDAVKSIRAARTLGADEIHIEPMTLQSQTLVELLIKHNLFRLPSLYSVYEVLRRVVPGIKPYVSPFMHMPLPARIPRGCPSCTSRLIDGLLNRYNIERTPESLYYDDCSCIKEWRRNLSFTDPRPLEERVSDALTVLRRKGAL